MHPNLEKRGRAEQFARQLQAQLLRGEIAEKRALVAAVADARARRDGAELTRAELGRMYARSVEAHTRQLVDVIEKQKFAIAGLTRRGEKLELQRAEAHARLEGLLQQRAADARAAIERERRDRELLRTQAAEAGDGGWRL